MPRKPVRLRRPPPRSKSRRPPAHSARATGGLRFVSTTQRLGACHPINVCPSRPCADDKVHKSAPAKPTISSETSSAVSDRGEYTNNRSAGHVRGYDTERPIWGQTAEAAWGGVGEPGEQGILTRPFVAGGFTWTGWDYKGEPTPYGWPDVNSHFGILDIAGFEKVRAAKAG